MAEAQMPKRVRLVLLIIFLLITESQLNANETKSSEYLKFVNEITNSFAKEMEKECDGLICIGSGGSMPHDVEKIEVLFVAYRKVGIEDARKMEVYGIQKLLNKINAHEKIRPYLKEHPFKADRIGMSISFQTEDNHHIADGSVAYVSLIKNRVFYDRAEMRKEMTAPGADCRDLNNIIEIPPRERIVERLIDLFEEPYEDAVKIVQRAVSTEIRDRP
jgi:hypothetical protein